MAAPTTHMTTTPTRHVPFVIPRMLQTILWIPVRLLLNLFCDLRVQGVSNVTSCKHNSILLVANHLSELDPIVIRASLPPLWKKSPLFFVSAPLSEFRNGDFSWRRWLYGTSWFFSLWGAHPAVRGTKSYASSLKTHTDILETPDTCLLIFPEGQRVRHRDAQKFHGGAGFLANLPHVAAIPVAISGLENISATRFVLRKSKVRVRFGVPLDLSRKMFGTVANPDYEAAEHIMKHVYTHKEDIDSKTSH